MGAQGYVFMLQRLLWVAGIFAITAIPVNAQVSYNFNTDNGNFTAADEAGNVANQWTYSATAGVAGSGGWFINNSSSSSLKHLTSPTLTVVAGGSVSFNFDHRFNFEYSGTVPNGDAFDGGQLQVSINGGGFTLVPNSSIAANGYTPDVDGVDALGFTAGWSSTSAGYGAGSFINTAGTITGLLAGDTIAFRWRAGWDGSVAEANPAWELDNISFGNVSAVPEPATIALCGMVVTGAVLVEWKRRRRNSQVALSRRRR